MDMNTVHSDKDKRKRTIVNIGIAVLVITLVLILIVNLSNATSEKNLEENILQKPAEKVASSTIKPKVQEKVVEKPTGKVVYLTFDDGPSQLTEQFLDLLQEHDVKATFFMQGNNLKKESLKESVKRATKEGHYIGGHSMTHEFQTLYAEEQFVPEMNDNLALIYEITGIHSNLVRPPYGSAPGLQKENIRNEIAASGIKVWDWTIDSRDWALKNEPYQIIENIKKETNKDVEVVLMHEKAQTLQVLPEIITFFKQEGYEFVVYNDEAHFSLNFLNDIRF